MTPLLSFAQEPWAQALGWSLLHFLWQGSVLGLLAWVALVLLRGSSAKARYGAACAFLLLMVAAPVATFLLLRAQPAGPAAPLPLALEAGAGLAPGAPLSLRAKAALDPILPWLLGTWALGVVLLSGRFLGSWIRVQRLRRRSATPVAAEWHLVLSRLCRDLKLSRTVRLLQSAAVEVPTALGWLRPVILLPACALAGLAPAQLEAILAHELAHIRRGDFLVNLLQSLVEVLLFYHPAVWWLSGRIRAERELCCDDEAAALCGDPLILARALTDLEALRQPPTTPPATLALAANGGSLMHRIRHLLHPALPPSSGARAAALALLAASLLGAAGVAFQDQETPEPGHTTRRKVIDGDRRVDLQMDGEVKLDPGGKEPVAIPGEGRFRAEETRGGKTRTYTASKGGRTYAVDGRETPLDAEGEAWLRAVAKDAAQAQGAKDKVRHLELRGLHLEEGARHLEARERELEAQAQAMETRLRDLEHRAKEAPPEEQARLRAEGERLKAEGETLKAEGQRLKAEGERLRNDPELKALIAKARAEGRQVRVVTVREKDGRPGTVILREGQGGQATERRIEVLTEDVGPDAVVIRERVDGKEVVEKRIAVAKDGHPGTVVIRRHRDGKLVEERRKILREGGDSKHGGTWAFLGSEGEAAIVEGAGGPEEAVPVPPGRLRKLRLKAQGPGALDPLAEIRALQSAMTAMQRRLDQLQRQMALTPRAPRAVPPPPPPPPAPPAPDAPPPPPPPPAPPVPPAPEA